MSDEPEKFTVGHEMKVEELVRLGLVPEEFLQFAGDGEGAELITTVGCVTYNTLTRVVSHPSEGRDGE